MGRIATMTSWSNEVDRIDGALIAAAPDMLAALHHVRSIIKDGAMTGFNCLDGDWAERLFASQAVTHAAVTKAEPVVGTHEGSGKE